MKSYIYKIAIIFTIIIGSEVNALTKIKEKDLIRIAVLQNQQTIHFDEADKLSIKDLSGRRFKFSKTKNLTISTCRDGFAVNKKCYLTERLIISSSDNILINDLILRGAVRLIRKDNAILVVNVLGIEDYLKGVVPMEMPAKWHIEALKAQAIVARTYALFQKYSNKEKDFDLYSTTDDQVYGGKKREDKRTTQAISDTKGMVLTFGNKLIFSAYHSTSGGHTENTKEVWSKEFPYLIGVECRFDRESPYYKWGKKIDLSDLEDSLKKAHNIGDISTITPFLWTRTGRVNAIRIIHSKGESILNGNEFRRLIGYASLPSAKFDIKGIGSDVYFEGKGAGHGVGLCQWGSKGMAEKGFKFDKILKHYYPGTKLARYG